MNKNLARKRRGLKTKMRLKYSDRPRVVVFRSAQHIYTQIVTSDKLGDKVLASASTVDKELKTRLTGSKSDKAKEVGKLLAQRALKNNLLDVAFDRSGYRYHGRIKALADGAREAGLKF